MLQNRSIAMVIILGLVTCGIYPLYWLYQTATGLENEGHSGAGLDPVLIVVISLFFPYVGYLLFGMSADQKNILSRVLDYNHGVDFRRKVWRSGKLCVYLQKNF